MRALEMWRQALSASTVLRIHKDIDMTRYHATAEGNIPFTPDEELEWDAREAAHAAKAPKAMIRSQIAALEAKITVRRQREAILGTDNGWLASVDAEIAALRTQL